MNKSRLSWIFAVLLIFTLSSCSFLTTQATPDQSEVQTMVSLRVEQTQIAATMAALQPFVTPTLLPGQPTPLPPTETLTPTVTLTPEPTLTPTPSGVWLTITENTNCRTGPASYYRLVLSLKVGDQVEATGINPNSDYYYVVNPSDANSYCWVWNKYAIITGNPSILPVYTPQPTATPTSTPTIAPDFSFSYISLNNCGGQYAIKIKVRNTGSLTWKSIRMVVKDNTASSTFTHQLDTFRSYDGCTVEVDQKDLTFGEDGLVTNYNPGQLGYDPTGHALTITVTLYSADGRTGTSLSRSINVTP
jgi:hypothetical protein